MRFFFIKLFLLIAFTSKCQSLIVDFDSLLIKDIVNSKVNTYNMLETPVCSLFNHDDFSIRTRITKMIDLENNSTAFDTSLLWEGRIGSQVMIEYRLENYGYAQFSSLEINKPTIHIRIKDNDFIGSLNEYYQLNISNGKNTYRLHDMYTVFLEDSSLWIYFDPF